jgi:hypothetical protein
MTGACVAFVAAPGAVSARAWLQRCTSGALRWTLCVGSMV